MALEAETEFFNRHRQKWIDEGHEGEWAVVRAEELVGLFPSLRDAYEAGKEACGSDEFLVKEIRGTDRIETIQRVHWGARGQRTAVQKESA